MAGTFPTLVGIDIAVKRTTVYATGLQTSSSGLERRARFQSTPVYRYNLRINSLNTARAGNELSTLVAFFESQAGRFDTFNFTDPVDGTVRSCRFDSDELDVTRIVSALWESGVDIISVKT
jgi:hypothetical protein